MTLSSHTFASLKCWRLAISATAELPASEVEIYSFGQDSEIILTTKICAGLVLEIWDLLANSTTAQ